MYTLWCLVEQETTPFPVDIMPTLFIGKLKDEIKKAKAPDLDKIAANNLILWKLDVDLNDPAIEESIDEGQFQLPPLSPPNNKALKATKRISEVWFEQPPAKHLSVFVKLPDNVKIVQMPYQGNPILVDAVGGAMPGQDVVRFRESCSDVIIRVASRDRNKVFSQGDVQRNGFVSNSVTNPPDFVKSFWESMLGKLDINGSVDVDSCLDTSKLFEALPQKFREGLHLTSEAMECDGLDVLCHLLTTASFKEKYWSERDARRLGEEDTKSTFFDRLARSGLLPDEATCLFRQRWPITLAVKVDNVIKLMTYTPQSDFSLWINGFPRLVWELCSDHRSQKDKWRMRAYGTSIVKLGNCILKDSGKSPHFILVAIYQAADGATISAFYEEDGKIYQREETLHLGSTSGRFEFTRRLYKLAKIFKSHNGDAFHKLRFIRGLAAYVETDEFDGTVYTRNSKKRKADAVTSLEDGGGPSGSGFSVQRYELISDVIMDGKGVLEPLWKLPSHIHRMRRHDDPSGTVFIIKECRQESNEAQILKVLQTLKPPCKHIISLIETIETNAGTFLVFPERQSVKEQLHCFTDGGDLRGMFLDLSRDLTIGLSFLHKNGIAHLDIKPSNLVYTSEPRTRLEIIDFDVAVQVQNEEEEIDDYCGSRDWMAPEIGEESGPRRMYSPMRADKWSCGRVLRLFAERHGNADEGLRGFAARLMNCNPRNRPPLLEWHENRTKARIAVPKKRRRVDSDVAMGMFQLGVGVGVQPPDAVMVKVKAH